MVSAYRDAGGKLFVVKVVINLGRLGRNSLGAVSMTWPRLRSYGDAVPWRGCWDPAGGALVHQSDPDIDLLDQPVCPGYSVRARTVTLDNDIQVEGMGAFCVRQRHDRLPSIGATILANLQNLHGLIALLVEKGTMKVDGTAVNKIDSCRFNEARIDGALIKGTSYQLDASGSVYCYLLYYNNGIKTLHGEADPRWRGGEPRSMSTQTGVCWESASPLSVRQATTSKLAFHECPQPTLSGAAEGRTPWHAGYARCDAECQLHNRLQRHDQRYALIAADAAVKGETTPSALLVGMLVCGMASASASSMGLRSTSVASSAMLSGIASASRLPRYQVKVAPMRVGS